MGSSSEKNLSFIVLSVMSSPACSGAIILGLNLEFVDARFNEEGFDGGFGIHAGYEFNAWHNWHFGGLFEYFNGWYNRADLEVAGEMTYDSKSLYATARPVNWPLMLKAGLVRADYNVLQQDMTHNFREADATGYAYGISLVFGNDSVRIDYFDYKRIRIGSDSFDSFGISLGVLFGS